VRGDNIYWVENAVDDGGAQFARVKTADLRDRSISTVADVAYFDYGSYDMIGVTGTTVLLQSKSGYRGIVLGIESFPLDAGVPDGGAPALLAAISAACNLGQLGVILSDTDAVYLQCIDSELGLSFSIIRAASDGTITVLGQGLISATPGAVAGADMAVDDKYLYWLDRVQVGTVMRVTKTGGTPSTIARDTFPVAIAVDANAIYWSDQSGTIMRLQK
jgi:hypothetical protein